MKVIQERDRLPSRVVLAVGGGVIAMSVLFTVIAIVLLDCRQAELGPRARDDRNRPPPVEMNAMEMSLFDEQSAVEVRQQRQRRLLDSYGWVDREAGLVRIPIERAMELYLEEPPREAP